MARLAMMSAKDSKPDGPLAAAKDYQYYMTILLDGFGTEAERTVIGCFFALYAHLPTDVCLVTILFATDEVRRFKNVHSLMERAAPLIFITEVNPFVESKIKQSALLELGLLREADDIKKILATLAEQAHDINLIHNARKGELLRKIQTAISKYGGVIGNALSMFGLG